MIRFLRALFFKTKTITALMLLEKKVSDLSLAGKSLAARSEEVLDRVQSEVARLRQLCEDQRLVIRKQEEALDSLRDQVKTYEQITVPGLVAAHQTFIARWEAEAKVQAIRSELARPGQS